MTLVALLLETTTEWSGKMSLGEGVEALKEAVEMLRNLRY